MCYNLDNCLVFFFPPKSRHSTFYAACIKHIPTPLKTHLKHNREIVKILNTIQKDNCKNKKGFTAMRNL